MIIINFNEKFIQEKIQEIFNNFPNRTFQKHEIEEITYRLYLCKGCFGSLCTYCGCNPIDTVTDLYPCNNGDKYPKLHSNDAEWREFKKQNNIKII